MLDGNARLNLATFVTTWMEPQAEKLMAESFDKNMIDKDEYPFTAMIEERCINIVTRLFNAPETGVGASAIGSSEAVMLAGMALKWKWRERSKPRGSQRTSPISSWATTSRSCGKSLPGIGMSSLATSKCSRDNTRSRPKAYCRRGGRKHDRRDPDSRRHLHRWF